MREFDAVYTAYQRDVPMLIPRPFGRAIQPKAANGGPPTL